MSVARHHAEWLSLVEVSGPFLSMPVLLRAFPQELERHVPEVRRALHEAHADWRAACSGSRPDLVAHRAFARFLLGRVLELPDDLLAEDQRLPPGLAARAPGGDETLRPDFALLAPSGREDAGRPRLLVQIVPPRQDLERPVPGRGFHASPEVRLATLLRGTGVRLGLVTNGDGVTLVHAPRDGTTTFARFQTPLFLEEPLTLRAFRSLLRMGRFFGVAAPDALESLFDESLKDQHEVTDQLGLQVRHAVELLVQAWDRVDRDRGRSVLAGLSERRLYEAAVTVMMRLVFLLAAEERDLLPLRQQPAYHQAYAASTLLEHLREAADRHGEEVLERRFAAFGRLLATFRAVHGGVAHDLLRLPAYGGSLFDPDRFPFLEGRPDGSRWRGTPARPLPVDDRTVLHLLESLQVLRVRVPGGGPAEARRLSFRALDVEQIGHVYEGLLDHTARRADGPVLGVAGTRDHEPEIPLDHLEAARAGGEDPLVALVAERTARSESAVRRALSAGLPGGAARLRAACENDDALAARVRPFAGLLRVGPTGYPVVIPKGSLYVTEGTDRRSTGTHYTPLSLTEPVVEHTLDPRVYDGPDRGLPRADWRLRPARDLLALKVCDPAMGSGAFLVQACRYLAGKLVEAWAAAERAAPGRVVVTPEGDLSDGLPAEAPVPRDEGERLAAASRIVADRNLYGVDRNPLAVEMAKLSLWLVTLQRDRPFTFLDHALKCGDSLLGFHDPDQVRWLRLDPRPDTQVPPFARRFPAALERAVSLREELEAIPDREARDTAHKQELLARAEQAVDEVRLLGDLVVGTALRASGRPRKVLEDREAAVVLLAGLALDPEDEGEGRARRFADLRARADDLLALPAGLDPEAGPRRPFHWVVEFPEVFSREGRRGFDAVVGNPPFQGGQRITGALGTDHRDYLVRHLARGQRGSADLCAYFFLRARALLGDGGGFGLLATNTIAQGDTREVGLEQVVEQGSEVVRAVPSRPWPGTANLEVAHVWVRRGPWAGERWLDDRQVPGITPFLTVPGTVTGRPHRLKANEGKSYIGSYVLGMGFVMSPDEAARLIDRDPRNRRVLFPYLNGEDLNSRPDQSPSRWVINFRDWPLARTATGRWEGSSEERRKDWLRSGMVPKDYPDEVAEDFPDCISILRERVMPERTRKRPDGEYQLRHPLYLRWWQYAEKRPELYRTIAGMSHVVVKSEVGNRLSFAAVENCAVFSHMLVVFAAEEAALLGVLQSSIHESWARQFGSTMRTDLRYTPSDCVEAFPFPVVASGLPAMDDYQRMRARYMTTRGRGLTQTCTDMADPSNQDADVAALRELHTALDLAVASAYGWTGLDLGHGFHPTKQGIRFTISERARQEVLARLLRLNHERYAEEVAQGLHRDARTPAPRAPRARRVAAEALATGAVPVAHADLPLFGGARVRRDDDLG